MRPPNRLLSYNLNSSWAGRPKKTEGSPDELHLWHERSLPDALSNLAREVTISEGATSLGTIRVTESAELVQPHKNKYGHDYDPSENANPIYNH